MPIKDIKQSLGLGAPIEDAVKKTRQLNEELSRTDGLGNRLTKTFKNIASSLTSAGKGGISDTRIASLPAPNNFYAQVSEKNTNRVGPESGGPNGKPTTDTGTGAGGGSAFTRYVSSVTGGGTGAAAGAIGLMGVGSGMLNSAQQYIYQQLATSRLGYYGLGGAPGGTQAAYGNVTDLFNKINKKGLLTDQQDSLRAMVSAQRQGLAGGGQAQFGNMMEGFATASVTTPGLGVSGAAQASAPIYAGSTTNQLLTAGIRTRNPDGTPRPPTAIADDIWAMMNRVKSKQGDITVNDLNTLLTPGFTLARFLDFYFGTDTSTRQMITDMLYYKAQSKGAKMSSLNLKDYQNAGGVTGAVVTGTQRTAAGASVLASTAPQAVKGIEFGNQVATSLANLATAAQNASGLVGVFAQGSMAMQTVSGIGNGGVGKFLSGLPLIRGLFKAEGGPVDGRSPYIVGEKGPELFVPKTDGTIVPNHKLNNPFREDGVGDLTAGGMKVTNPNEFATALIKGLGGKPTPGALDALVTWMRFEGGHWRNKADYNPLNTTLNMTGARSVNTHGVDAYTSWDQGLEATIKTLTGRSAKERGYTDIVNAIKSGDKQRILNAVNNSSWRTGDAGGAGSYGQALLSSSAGAYSTQVKREKGKYNGNSKAETGTGTGTRSTGGTTVSSNTSQVTQSLDRSLSGAVASDFSKSGGGVSNYFGGITIHVTGKADAKQIGTEVKKAIKDLALDKSLGTK